MTQVQLAPEDRFRHRLTVDQFHAMSRAGILPEGGHFELLEGELYGMDRVDDPHAEALNGLDEEIRARLAGQVRVRVQIPIVLGNTHTEPEPDLTVVRPDAGRGKPRAHEILAVIELAVIEIVDSSLSKDRGIKQRVYASAGIPEYWIVDVAAVRLEIYRQPGANEYKLRQVLEKGEKASLAAFPEVLLSWW